MNVWLLAGGTFVFGNGYMLMSAIAKIEGQRLRAMDLK